jgi:hypothetical protein
MRRAKIMNVAAAIILSLLPGALGADAVHPGAAPADLARARQLVKQLGDARFNVRDAAEKELMRLGLAAFEALKEGEKDTDLHVHERCRALQLIVSELMLQKQIEHFKNKESGPEALIFAESFLKITGDTKEARELYAEAMIMHSQLLDDVWRDRKNGVQTLHAYCDLLAARIRFQQDIDSGSLIESTKRAEPIKRADLLVFFFLSQELPAEKDGSFSNYCYQVLRSRTLTEILSSNSPDALPFKKLFIAWINHEPQEYMVQRGLEVAAQAEMKELLPLALRIANDKSARIHYRAQVALLLCTLAAKENLKDIEPLLEDKTFVRTVNTNNTSGLLQMRDVALAVCIKLSGQKIADYDFDVMKSEDVGGLKDIACCAFTTVEKREASHQKYKEFREKAAKK